MTNTAYTELFEGAPYCEQCRCKLRRLGRATVSCDHTSFTVGIDKLNAAAYNNWMATESELAGILEVK